MKNQTHTIKVGIDTGGTFTDVVMKTNDEIHTHKILSTPQNPATAVLQGIRELLSMVGLSRETALEIVHGSTVATNSLLERKGARIALITTQGFEDILEIGRQSRPALYDFFVERPEPPVPATRRIGVRERTLYTGEIQTPIDLPQLDAIADRLTRMEVDIIAICFLFSYINPQNELLAAKRLSALNLPIVCSHQVLPEYREYERFSTTVANAFVLPKVDGYIGTLQSEVNPRSTSLRLMQSNGGSISAQTAREEPIRTALSGPAGGVIGAYEIAKIAGYDKIISFDMGGTSTDVSLCDGKIMMTTESVIGGMPIKLPMIDIHTVGAGGGSIAEIDVGGALHVGPRSAGAHPGPICYGKGNELTVTDANLFLGRIDSAGFLNGRMRLERERVVAYIGAFAERLGLTPVQVAEGILKVANATMERAIRVISVERGFDTRDFTLISFGGAGGLHACELARNLAIPTVMIPPNGGLLSAYGMLFADIVKDYSQTVLWKTAENQENLTDRIQLEFAPLLSRAESEMKSEGFSPHEIITESTLDMRYEGQSYELNVPAKDFIENFHRIHQARFGYMRRNMTVEVVNLRLSVIGKTVKPEIKPERLGLPDSSEAWSSKKNVIFDDVSYETNHYQRERLKPGNQIASPAIVSEFSATTVIPPDFCAKVDAYRNLVLIPKQD